MSEDDLVYDGRLCIGSIRDLGRQFEAWTADRESLGRHNTYRAAAAAIYAAHVLERQRQGGGR